MPGSTGTPYFSKTSRAWYSKRSTLAASSLRVGVVGEQPVSRHRDSSTSRDIGGTNPSAPARLLRARAPRFDARGAPYDRGVRAARDWPEYAADGALVLGGAAAILLQLGDPVVARGVAAHSAFARDPLRRLEHTLAYVYAVSLGDDELERLVAGMVDGAHSGVPGARDAAHQIWVAATLCWTGMRTHALLRGAITAELADEIVARSERLATALQTRPGAWPRDRTAFADYWDARIPALEIGPEAREVAGQLLHPTALPWWARPAMPIVRALTPALLPPTVREAYGLPLRRGRAALALALVRALLALAPRRLSELPSRHVLERLRRHAARRSGKA
nr:oxygenase MpaB family protein [Schumannella luteola]